jgi:hypothetical protein
LPTELGRPPKASLLWQARRNVRARWERLAFAVRLAFEVYLAFEVHLAKERKGVVADYRFAGELRSLPVDL